MCNTGRGKPVPFGKPSTASGQTAGAIFRLVVSGMHSVAVTVESTGEGGGPKAKALTIFVSALKSTLGYLELL